MSPFTRQAIFCFVRVVGWGAIAAGLFQWLSGATPSRSVRWGPMEHFLHSQMGSFGMGMHWFVLGTVVLVLAWWKGR